MMIAYDQKSNRIPVKSYSNCFPHSLHLKETLILSTVVLNETSRFQIWENFPSTNETIGRID